MKPLRILVADTWGTEVHPSTARQFPNIQWTVHTRTNSPHPHGHQVAECCAKMLPPDHRAEICFYPYLTLQSRNPMGWAEVIRDARMEGNPFDLAICSFGFHHGNNRRTIEQQEALWADGKLLNQYRELLGDTPVVFASGNHDSTTPWAPDLSNDVCYPQKPLSTLDNVFVVGACNIRGVPMDWSADGLEVTCAYLGHQVRVLDPITGRYTRVDGTSFAAPLCAGDMGCLITEGHQITREYFESYVLAHGLIPVGWERGRRHPKDGLGTMLSAMEKRLGISLHTLSAPARDPQEYFDFTPYL